MRGVFGLVALASLAIACGGPAIPTHGGYASRKAKPWRKPIVLVLDAKGEAEGDDMVSYPRRERARWFAVDLPSGGELDVELSVTAIGEADKGFDVPFEILDEGFRVLSKADGEEDDAGDEEKRRTLYELPPGRYYIHVYTSGRLDEADVSLHLAFRPAEVASVSGFPGTVAFVGQLPDVPKLDDAPLVVVRPKCKGKACDKPRPPPPVDKSLRARIAGITTAGANTTLKIDRGSNDGIAVGWRGEVITRDGKAIPGGRFEVSRVTQREAYGTVKASSDAVTAAKYVRLRAPTRP